MYRMDLEALPRETIFQIMAANPVAFAKLAQTARAYYDRSVSKAGRDDFAHACADCADDFATFKVKGRRLTITYTKYITLCADLPTVFEASVDITDTNLRIIKLKLFAFNDTALLELPFACAMNWEVNGELHREGGPAMICFSAPGCPSRDRSFDFWLNGHPHGGGQPHSMCEKSILISPSEIDHQKPNVIHFDGFIRFPDAWDHEAVHDIRPYLEPYEDRIRRCFPQFRYVRSGCSIIAKV